jgi:Fanconi-associated nuclease 1
VLPSRAELIERRLTQLQTADLRREVQAAWDAHVGELCYGVSWDLLDRDALSLVAACIGGSGGCTRNDAALSPHPNYLGNKVVAGVCDLLAQDYRNRSGGMPDLVLWRRKGAR